MAYTVTLIPGDGIGPEVTGATQEVLAAAGAPISSDQSVFSSQCTPASAPTRRPGSPSPRPCSAASAATASA